MKKIVLLFLVFAVVFASEPTKEVEVEGIQDIIEIIKCIAGNEKLRGDIITIIRRVVHLDIEALVLGLYRLFADGVVEILECIFPTKEKNCIGFKICIEKCKNKYQNIFEYKKCAGMCPRC